MVTVKRFSIMKKLKELKTRLSDYYENELESKLFEYELLK